MKFILNLIFAIVLTNLSNAQHIRTYTLEGLVTDKETNEPIPGSQIFLNGTTIGTSSLSDGSFTLKKIPAGVYDLVVSFLGYERRTITIDTDSLRNLYQFELVPLIYYLEEIVVSPDPKLWQQDFETFRKIFIGKGPFSRNTKILNPEVLSFNFDHDARVFSAKATDRLIIENKALGYKVYYWLEYFVVNYAEKTNSYAGRPFFEPMQSKRKRINNRWAENRFRAYHGSIQHFINSLLKDSLSEDGFLIQLEKRINGERHVYPDLIERDYFFAKIDSNTYAIEFDDYLNITYEYELEDISYLDAIASPLDPSPRTLVQPQNSIVFIAQDSLLIDKSGYFYNPTAFVVGGYWGFESISDLLPLDYLPEIKL